MNFQSYPGNASRSPRQPHQRRAVVVVVVTCRLWLPPEQGRCGERRRGEQDDEQTRRGGPGLLTCMHRAAHAGGLWTVAQGTEVGGLRGLALVCRALDDAVPSELEWKWAHRMRTRTRTRTWARAGGQGSLPSEIGRVAVLRALGARGTKRIYTWTLGRKHQAKRSPGHGNNRRQASRGRPDHSGPAAQRARRQHGFGRPGPVKRGVLGVFWRRQGRWEGELGGRGAAVATSSGSP